MPFATDTGQQRSSTEFDASLLLAALDPAAVGGLVGGQGMARDLTPVHQILQLVPVALHVCDAAGRLTFCNRRAIELLGCEPRLHEEDGGLFGGAYAMFELDGSPVAPDANPVAIALREGRSFRDVEARLVRPDGVAFAASVTVDPLRDAEGTRCGAILAIQDITRRRDREERLRAREAELQLVGAHAPVILSHWDAHNRLVFATRAFAGRWNKTPEQLVGKTMAEILGATAGAALQPHVDQALAGRPVEFEMAVPYEGIGERFVRVAYAPHFSAAGEVRGYFSAVTDITAGHEAENALRESEERLRMATQTGKVGLWDWEIRPNRLTCTESLHQILGVSRDEFDATVEGFVALIHPADRAPVQRAMQCTLDHGTPYELEFRVVRPGGAMVWLFTNAAVMHENGEPVRMVGAALDITARKTAELALRESEGRFRALASHAPVGIFLTAANGDCVFVNDCWRMMTGLSRDEARGRGWTQAVHPDDRERIAKEWYACVRERRPFVAEFRFLRRDGTIFCLEGSAVESRNASGGSTGHIGIVVDITLRKRAAEALRESEKRFRTLASHAPVGIFLTDAQGDTVFVNEAWSAIVGVPPERAQGRGWSVAIHPDDRARVEAEWEDAVRRGASSNAEYRFRHADGSVIWVQGHAVQLRDDAGRPAGYIGTIADVTERRRAEEKLRAQESQLRLISTNAPIMLAHHDREQRLLFVNRAYAARFHLAPDDIVGRTIGEVLGPEAHEAIAPYITRVLAGESLNYEMELNYRGIGRRFMRVACVPDVGADGTVRGWLSATSDITDDRRTQDALRRLAAIVESSDDAIISKDLTGIITSWNKGAELIFGYPTGEILGQSIARLTPPGREAEELAIVERIRRGERIHHYETHRRRRDGALIDVALTISPLRDDSGAVVGASTIARDITERKRAEAELRAAQERLQTHASELEQKVQERTASLLEAMVQMEEFSYSVSHDLRAPLRAMNAYAQALAEDYGGQLDATARSYLDRIQRGSRRMEKLTHDVLTYSRVARAEVQLTELNLETVLLDLISQYSELQPPSADVKIVRPLHRVRGHESSLGQCLANLLTNAAKFVEPGVRPRIRVRTEAAGDPSTGSGQGRVRVWVEDNGIGVLPDYQAGLFRVFERVPTIHAYEGTGIGLAIVRKAVEKMGGRCGVESDGRTGSRFWIELSTP